MIDKQAKENFAKLATDDIIDKLKKISNLSMDGLYKYGGEIHE